MKRFQAFSDIISNESDLADFARTSMGGKRLICFDRQVPVNWLWHPGRLLPALIWDAAKRSGYEIEALALFHVPSIREYAYLSRAYLGDIDGVAGDCIESIKRVLKDSYTFAGKDGLSLENVHADRLIQQFMFNVIKSGMSKRDIWDWRLFKRVGRPWFGPKDPILHDWRQLYADASINLSSSCA